MDRLTIEKLPDTKLVEGAKRWEEEKGEFVQIAYKEDIGHLALFQLREGFWRGSHYHEQKDETFYIVRGTMRAVFRDMDSGDQSEAILEKGLRVRVRPRLAHIFFGLDDALVVEYSHQYYDQNDAVFVDFSDVSA